jgi:hypothetical protein
VRVIVEKLVEWRLAGETEVLGENLPPLHFMHHKSHMTRPGFEILVGKSNGKRPLGISRWEDIRSDLIETRWVLWNGFIWLRIGTSGRVF